MTGLRRFPPIKRCGAAVPWSLPPLAFSVALRPNSE